MVIIDRRTYLPRASEPHLIYLTPHPIYLTTYPLHLPILTYLEP
jgi:hypothetical protein